jgi:adenosylcobinamide-GDP ribazoletransferase
VDAFLIALQFLTRIPVSHHFVADDRALGYSVLFYPVVGLLLGALLATLAALLTGSPSPLAAALVITAWVLLTGGLHLDGLADCADAWVGGFGNPQRSLEIMKDPTSGPIAVAVLVLVLLLKWSALMALLDQHRLMPLLFAPLLGRSAIMLLMLSTPYVSPQGLAEKLLQHLPVDKARWVTGVSLLIAVAGLGWTGVLLAALLLLVIRHTAKARLGGATGDVYGAAVELTETAALLAVAL